jgi:hypothetical protein
MSAPVARGVGSVFPGWHPVTNLKWRAEKARDIGAESYLRAYRSTLEHLYVLVAWEVGNGWHLSISHPKRYPMWDEIKAARYDLIPDAVTMGMLLPPKGEYVALHQNCFHLHEIDPGTE